MRYRLGPWGFFRDEPGLEDMSLVHVFTDDELDELVNDFFENDPDLWSHFCDGAGERLLAILRNHGETTA